MSRRHLKHALILILTLFVFLASSTLPAYAVEHTQVITLGGNSSSDPLQIDVYDNGRIGFYFWQHPYGNPANPQQYVQQYYGNDCWGTNLFFTRDTTNIHYSTDYFQDWYMGDSGIGTDTNLGTLVSGTNQVTGTWLLDEGRISFVQIISYTPGSYLYEKTFRLVNNTSDVTFSGLKVIHGGDTYFGGDDAASSYWNELLNMIYLRNSSMDAYGLMGFAGTDMTPADYYFGGNYHTGNQQAMSGQLSSTADSTYLDAGYQLQWNHAALAPGETWEIRSFEMITEPNVLQVLVPAEQAADPGDVLDYDFVLINFSGAERIVDLQAVSEHSWITSIEGSSQVTLAANGGSATVRVHVTVPADAASLMTDNLTLTATDHSDPSKTASGSTRTTVRQQPPRIVSVTPAHPFIYRGTTSLDVSIVTAETPDAANISIELLDASSNPLAPAITAAGTVSGNAAALTLTLPADLAAGSYKIRAALTGAAETKTADLEVRNRPVINAVTPDSAEVAQGDTSLSVLVQTTYLPAGSAVQLTLLDAAKVPFAPAVTGSGNIGADGSVTIVMTLPDNLPLATYYLRATASGAEEHNLANFSVYQEDIPVTGETSPLLPLAGGFALLALAGFGLVLRRRLFDL